LLVKFNCWSGSQILTFFFDGIANPDWQEIKHLPNPGLVVRNRKKVIKNEKKVVRNLGLVVLNLGLVVLNFGAVVLNGKMLVRNKKKVVRNEKKVVQNEKKVVKTSLFTSRSCFLFYPLVWTCYIATVLKTGLQIPTNLYLLPVG